MTSTASMHLPTVWTESVRTVRARTVRVWTVRVRTVRVRTVGQESCAKECWCVRARGIARVLAPHTILCPQVGRNFLEIVKHHWSVWRVWHVWWVAQRGWKRGGARVSHLGAWSLIGLEESAVEEACGRAAQPMAAPSEAGRISVARRTVWRASLGDTIADGWRVPSADGMSAQPVSASGQKGCTRCAVRYSAEMCCSAARPRRAVQVGNF